VFGVIVIFIALIIFSMKLMICTVVGYACGFVFAVLFNTDTFDSNSGIYVNNDWIIWTASYLIFIAVGIVWEILNRYKRYKT